MTQKSQVFSNFQLFKNRVETQFNTKIKQYKLIRVVNIKMSQNSLNLLELYIVSLAHILKNKMVLLNAEIE